MTACENLGQNCWRSCARAVSYTHLDVYKRQAQKEQTLHEGSSAKLSFTVSPDDGQTKAVWSSNDPLIVSVAQDGIITALREGSTIINASLTFPDGRTGLASCAVTVTPHTGDVLSEPVSYTHPR